MGSDLTRARTRVGRKLTGRKESSKNLWWLTLFKIPRLPPTSIRISSFSSSSHLTNAPTTPSLARLSSTMASNDPARFEDSEDEEDFNPAPADMSDEERGDDDAEEETRGQKRARSPDADDDGEDDEAPKAKSRAIEAEDDEEDEDEGSGRRGRDDEEEDEEEEEEEEDDEDEDVQQVNYLPQWVFRAPFLIRFLGPSPQAPQRQTKRFLRYRSRGRRRRRRRG